MSTKVIKPQNKGCSVETMRYLPFEGAGSSEEDEPVSTIPDQPPEVAQRIDEIIREAESKAEDIVQKARLEAVDIKEIAFRSGYEEGQKAAAEEARVALGSVSKALEEALDRLASLKDDILSKAEDDIVRLTVAIAEKLVCRELKQHPDAIVSIVKETISAAKGNREITIKLHHDDLMTLNQHLSGLMEHIGETRELKIEEDTAISPGGCIVETDTNLIDMSLEARIESIDEALSNL